MTALRRVAFAALLVLAPACRDGCSGGAPREPTPRIAPQEPPPPPLVRTPRCVREVERAAVAELPGSGSIESVAATCAAGTLGLFVVRGGVLSRVTRATAAGEGFGAALTVSTGVDRLGPVAERDVRGPLAWRSPFAGIDEHEREDLWTAVLRDDGTSRALRGDALLPEGVVALGAVVAVAADDDAFDVYASLARGGEAPSVRSVRVAVGRDDPATPAALPVAFAGELLAWEATRGVALTRVDDGHGGRAFEVAWRGAAARVQTTQRARHALVAARGVATERGAAFFVGEFEREGGDAGRCMTVGEGMCVRPTALYVLLVGAPGAPLERVDITPAGLPDALTARGGELTVLYLAGEPGHGEALEAEQRAARIDVARREVTALTLTPPEGFGAIDAPTLVSCEDGVWLAAEVSVAPQGRRAVTALPLECLAR